MEEQILEIHVFSNYQGGGHPRLDTVSFYRAGIIERGAARATIAHLRTLDWPSYLVRSNSGAGYHLYLFFQHPLPSADVRRSMGHVLRIDDNERARVEINPLARMGQHGSSIHLPWWCQSKPSCNAFTIQIPR